MDIVGLINKYGFPIVAAGGMGYFVYYVWTWVTTEIKPVTSEANNVLIASYPIEPKSECHLIVATTRRKAR